MYSMGFSEIRRKKSFCLFNMRLHLIKNKEWVLFQDFSNSPPSSPFWWSLELLALLWWLTPWWQQDGPTHKTIQYSNFQLFYESNSRFGSLEIQLADDPCQNVQCTIWTFFSISSELENSCPPKSKYIRFHIPSAKLPNDWVKNPLEMENNESNISRKETL